MHVGFLNLCTAVTTDDDISSYVTEVELTSHMGFLNLCTTCANEIANEIFSFLILAIKQNPQWNKISMKHIVKRTQYEINGNLSYVEPCGFKQTKNASYTL